MGFEPTTLGSTARCSTAELRSPSDGHPTSYATFPSTAKSGRIAQSTLAVPRLGHGVEESGLTFSPARPGRGSAAPFSYGSVGELGPAELRVVSRLRNQRQKALLRVHVLLDNPSALVGNSFVEDNRDVVRALHTLMRCPRSERGEEDAGNTLKRHQKTVINPHFA